MTIKDDFEKGLEVIKQFVIKRITKAKGDAITESKDYTDIEIGKLAGQIKGVPVTLPSVPTKSALPNVSTLDPEKTYICLVIDENTTYIFGPGIIGSGGDDWEEYESLGTFVDTSHLTDNTAHTDIRNKIGTDISTHNGSGSAHSDIRSEINTKDGQNLKLTGDQNATGVKKFDKAKVTTTPSANDDVANKGYTDTKVGDLKAEISQGLNDAIDDFATAEGLN